MNTGTMYLDNSVLGVARRWIWGERFLDAVCFWSMGTLLFIAIGAFTVRMPEIVVSSAIPALCFLACSPFAAAMSQRLAVDLLSKHLGDHFAVLTYGEIHKTIHFAQALGAVTSIAMSILAIYAAYLLH